MTGRLELLVRATSHRVRGYGQTFFSELSVLDGYPAVCQVGVQLLCNVIGYTIANDMSSHEFEKTPLRFPQAKVFHICAGLGPGLSNEFTLHPGDEVSITMQHVGKLVNTMT